MVDINHYQNFSQFDGWAKEHPRVTQVKEMEKQEQADINCYENIRIIRERAFPTRAPDPAQPLADAHDIRHCDMSYH